MTRCWVGVASRDHVRAAVEGGFCQLNHGKEAPLKRIARGDRILYYPPREAMKAGKPINAFTAIGKIIDDEPYEAVQSERFKPFRRQVEYYEAKDAEIHPLLDTLSFSRGDRSWGQVLRRGFFEIEKGDYDVIAEAMASHGQSLTRTRNNHAEQTGQIAGQIASRDTVARLAESALDFGDRLYRKWRRPDGALTTRSDQ